MRGGLVIGVLFGGIALGLVLATWTRPVCDAGGVTVVPKSGRVR